MLSDQEQQAIEILKEYGWQMILGAHLEDWDEGQSILTGNDSIETIEARSTMAIIKV